MELPHTLRIKDIYIPVFQLCTKKRAGQDISRYIMGFIKEPTMNYINEVNIISRIPKRNLHLGHDFVYHTSNLVYQTMDIKGIKDIIEKNISKNMRFSHYCCGNKGVMYENKTKLGLHRNRTDFEPVTLLELLQLANAATNE
jgi:hypothetical protein